MQRYGDFRLFPKKQMISGREACGAYTKFAAEVARLANRSLKAFRDAYNTYAWAEKKAMEKGMAEGLEKGMEKGMAEGRAKERLANARSLMANGISLDIIVKSLELSPEEIEQLTVK